MLTRRTARRRDATRRPLLGDRIELVSARDGRTHVVRDVDYDRALADRAGWCRAVCGHPVIICSAFTPPGPPCSPCAAAS